MVEERKKKKEGGESRSNKAHDSEVLLWRVLTKRATKQSDSSPCQIRKMKGCP